MAITYGDWVRSKRGVEGEPGFITQQELADRMGVNRTRVVQIEKLEKIPKYETRQRIHAALGTTEDELIALGIVRQHTIQVPAATARAEAHPPTLAVTPSESHNPFEKNTWHWVVMQRVRQMNDEQAEDVASYAEYILTRKKAELPVIVRASKARDRVAP